MPTRPLESEVRIDELLTGFAVGYGQDLTKDFVADDASTVVRAEFKSDYYPTWNKGDQFRSVMEERADGTPAAEGGFRVDLTGQFKAEVYALKTLLTKRQEKQAGGKLALRKQKIRWLMGQAKLKRDLIYATTVFATGKWTREQTGVSGSPGANEFKQFNDAASDPIGVFDTEQAYVQSQTGKLFNVAVMPLDVAQTLQRHADITDLYKHTTPGPVAIELVAKALGVDRIKIANAIQNTGPQGGTDSMSRVFGKHILLVHVTDEMSDDEPTAVALYSWSEFDQVDGTGAAVREWWDDNLKGDWLEAEQAFDVKQTADDLGAFLLTAIA